MLAVLNYQGTLVFRMVYGWLVGGIKRKKVNITLVTIFWQKDEARWKKTAAKSTWMIRLSTLQCSKCGLSYRCSAVDDVRCEAYEAWRLELL